MSGLYNAGLYLRLSVDDAGNSAKRGKGNPFRNESVSIENQRDILTEYVRLRGWNIFGEYSDDGFSGGSFERPAFQKMLKDAGHGLINLILVKDLSRLGRDHIEVDHYVEDVFPALGVRFIALMDDIDSEGGSDILPFRSLLNDYHLKDLSRKIKSVLHAKAAVGEYVGAFAPYGYRKDRYNRGRLSVDSYAADVVRRIFDLRLGRMGYSKIAATLNMDGILAPRAYCYASEGIENSYNVVDMWRDRTVKCILKNEVYLGHSVKFKKRTLSYKVGKQVNRPEAEWIRVENTHTPIIPPEVWNKVQSVDLGRYDPVRLEKTEPSLFAGLLVCDNGHPMCCNTATKHYNGETRKYRSYFCGLHKQTGGAVCSWHMISEKVLLRIVQEDLKRQLNRIETNEDRAVAEIQSRLFETSLESTNKELQLITAKLSKIDEYTKKLYEDRLSKAVNLDNFILLSAAAEDERVGVQAEYDRLTTALETANKQLADVDKWISDVRRYLSVEMPERDILSKIIERIIIGERENRSIGAERRQRVTIIYRFVGFMD